MNDALPVTDDSWMVWEGLIVRLVKNMFLEKCLQLGYILTQICNAEGESGLNES